MENGRKSELKLTNWATFFLQRVDRIYNLHRLCDATLAFKTSETLPLHRIVLAACTDYFDDKLDESYQKQEHCIIHLDETFNFEVVSQIVKFMYTGTVDVNSERKDELYTTATRLRMNFIKTMISNLTAPPKPHLGGIEEPHSPQPAHQEVIKSVYTTNLAAPKRLNIWKRKPPGSGLNVVSPLREQSLVRVVLSKPVPTRFEWTGKWFDDFSMTMVGDSMNYMRLDNQMTCLQPLTLGNDTPIDHVFVPKPPPAKRPRLSHGNADDLKEMAIQQQIRHEIISKSAEMDAESSNSSPPKPILKQNSRTEHESPKKVRFRETSEDRLTADANDASSDGPECMGISMDDEASDVPPAMPALTCAPAPVSTPVISAPMPALAVAPILTLSCSTMNTNENNSSLQVEVKQKSTSSGEIKVTPPGCTNPKRLQYFVLNHQGQEIPNGEPHNVENPVKIVTELLAKNPDFLLGKRRSIKLKVVNSSVPHVDGMPPIQPSPSQVAYIIVKNLDAIEQQGDSLESDSDWPGPWVCTLCGPRSGKNLRFHVYTDYRKHINQVHKMSSDDKSCDLCGSKFSSKNVLLHHMYVKHNIKPPRPEMFPQCSDCKRVFMTSLALKKHIDQVHAGFICTVCGVSFKTVQSLALHLKTKWHQSRLKRPSEYPCPFCCLEYTGKDDLKRHIESDHQALFKKSTSEESATAPDSRECTRSVIMSTERDITATNRDTKEVEDSAPLDEQDSYTEPMTDTTSQEAYFDNTQEDPQIELSPVATIQPEGDANCDDQQTSVEYSEEHQQQPQEAVAYDVEPVYQERIVFVPQEEVYEESEQEAVYAEEGQAQQTFPEEQVFAEERPEDYDANKEAYSEEHVQDYSGAEETPVNGSYPSEEDPASDEMAVEDVQPEEAEKHEVGVDEEVSSAGADYTQYNPVVMFQPNVVMPQRVMLVTHPIAHNLQVLLPHNIMSADQLVPISYPQVQVVTTSTGQVIAPSSVVVTECSQRERKVERDALVNDWDENSQTDVQAASAGVAVTSGIGPSRPEFF